MFEVDAWSPCQYGYQFGDSSVKSVVTELGTDHDTALRYVSTMVTRLPRENVRLWIKEWLDHLNVSDERAAELVGVARQTVYRWHRGQRRPTREQIAMLAAALDLDPRDFEHRPPRRSIDALTRDLPDEIHGDVFEFAERLKKRVS